MNADIQAFDFSVDLMQAILWQYNDAARLQAILQAKQDWYDANQRDFWTNWHRDVFDLRTANDFGCAVWSIILEQPLVADPGAAPADYPAFGFGDHGMNFGHGNFARGATPQTMTTEQKRIILQLRYRQLVSRGTVPEINAMLVDLFGRLGPAWVVDNHDMSMTYVFGFEPPSALLQVLDLFDILPRPAGVGINRLVPSDSLRFGFAPYGQNFNNGTFAS